MSETRCTPDHMWIRHQAGTVTVGLTTFVLQVLGSITALHLPSPGQRVQAGSPCAVIESVKAASDAHAPVAGQIIRINPALPADLDLVNRDPEGAGWLWKMTPDNPDALAALMDAAAYSAFIQAL